MISTELKSHFLRLYQMAFADDNFHELELKMLYDFAKQRGITEEQLNKILLNPTFGISNIPSTVIEKITYLYELCLLIWVDGMVDNNESTVLKKYIRLFGFEDENVDELASYLLAEAKQGKPIETILNQL
ncbi:hypothetical protein [Winogradskyella sp.]|uniref:hypothetical protein n=1 Tax=Winogradskyella sp. TaxID=1883156 RepID=UPI003BAD7CBC